MNYAACLQYLSQLARFGIQPGTERLAAVLHRLGQPQARVPALHIAGTNGKGSTAAFCAHLLVAAAGSLGRPAGQLPRVGLYTSPHLCRVRERIRISPPHSSDGTDGTNAPDALPLPECSEEAFAAAVTAVRTACETTPAIDLTFFEVLTAAAFLVFAEAGVELAVFETGLGGRLDATRLCAAQVTVITGIALDHTEILGDTLTAIAYEKAGIFRPGVPALLACDDEAARAVLLAEAQRVGAPAQIFLGHDDAHRLPPDVAPIPPLPPSLAARLPLPGAHQYANAAVALAAVRSLPGPLGAATAQPTVQARGIAQTRWPGRLERLWPDPSLDAAVLRARLGLPDDCPLPEVWLDGAHNPQGAEALAGFISALPPRPLIVLFGVVADKQVGQMLAPLRLAQRLVLTTPPSPRARPANELAAGIAAAQPALPGLAQLTVEPDPLSALQCALRMTPEDGRLLIYGSLFLLGALRAHWHREARDPVALSDPGPKPSAAPPPHDR